MYPGGVFAHLQFHLKRVPGETPLKNKRQLDLYNLRGLISESKNCCMAIFISYIYVLAAMLQGNSTKIEDKG